MVIILISDTERSWSYKTNSPLKSTTIGLLALLRVLRTNTALAVGDVVVETVVDTGVVTSGAVVVSIQLNSSHGQPPAQFCLIKIIIYYNIGVSKESIMQL